MASMAKAANTQARIAHLQRIERGGIGLVRCHSRIRSGFGEEIQVLSGRQDSYIEPTTSNLEVGRVAGDNRVRAASYRNLEEGQICFIRNLEREWLRDNPFRLLEQQQHIVD